MENGPAVPKYVLRGHVSPIHALHFYSQNAFLASGDSEGWIVIWNVSSKRPVAVWKAHDGGIMQIKDWSNTRLITHGRDHKLRVWQVRSLQDIGGLSTKLPADGATPDQVQPWLDHSLSISGLNFCAFSLCDEDPKTQTPSTSAPQLIAAPNGLDSGGIDIFQLPSEHRVSQIHSDPASPSGMVMALSIFRDDKDSSRLVLISGYEDGRVMVHCHRGPFSATTTSQWQRQIASKPHSQPVLSVAVNLAKTHFFTSGADAVVAKFPVPPASQQRDSVVEPDKAVNTKHAGQQGISVRSDDKIFTTAGWDGRVRVYSSKTMTELAVLKWHKLGCYSTAFADVSEQRGKDCDEPESSSSSSSKQVTAPVNALDLIKQQREQKARWTHWLAAGGKDGKISLWDVY